MTEESRPSVAEELEIPRGNTEDPFASAVRATRMPMAITDPRKPDNPIVFCNDAFVRLTGYGRDEILGRNCRFLQGPATDEKEVARMRDAVRDRQHVEATLLNYRKDGSTFWNSILISPVFADGELTYFFASQLDVTDRKRADEHLFLLNRELDHRVKNTLATVQTVVHQTLRDGDVPERIAAVATGRIRAIARTHDVLTREAWASALVLDVVQGALDPLHDRFGDRIRVEGPDVRLKSRIATMLSLAMHELGENAACHGSLSSPRGTVDVRWSIGNGRFDLEWRERGGPAVRAPEQTGYGIRIVERVLAAEFGGTSHVEFALDGIAFRLSAPSDGLRSERTAWASPATGTTSGRQATALKDGSSLVREDDANPRPPFSTIVVHSSSNGDDWVVEKHESGACNVLHRANAASGGFETRMPLDEFLERGGAGPEVEAVRKATAT